MIQKHRIKTPADLKKLLLSGLAIHEVLLGSGGTDFAGITFRDTKTGTLLSLTRSAYSEIEVHATRPPKMEKRYIVTAPADGGAWRSNLLKEDELEAVKTAHPGCSVEETSVNIDELPEEEPKPAAAPARVAPPLDETVPF